MEQLVNKLKKLLPAKNKAYTPNVPPTAAGLLIQLHGLVRRQTRTEAALRQNMEKILAYKCREAEEEYRRKLDDAIGRAYFAQGGIRFHARVLQENVSILDPARDTVNTMQIRCYNSAISYMCGRLEQLEDACREWEHKIAGAQKRYREEAALYKAIGYIPCRDRIRALKGLPPRQLAVALPELRQTVLANERAVGQLLRQCAVQTVPYRLQHAGLLQDLRDLLDPAAVGRLASAEGWSAADYAAAAEKFAGDVRERLLLRYPLPGEQTEKQGGQTKQ